MINIAEELYSKTLRPLPGETKKWIKQKLATDAEFKEVFTFLTSFEINNYHYTKLFKVIPKREGLIGKADLLMYEYYGLLSQTINNKGYLEANQVFGQFPIKIQKIINSSISKSLIKFLGMDFILNTVDELHSWTSLVNSVFIYPKTIQFIDTENYNFFQKNITIDINQLTFPCRVISLPKGTRKYANLYYFIKKGNHIHSNLNNGEIRKYLVDNIQAVETACIFTYSKVKYKRKNKHFTPICFGNFKDILMFYRGAREVPINNLDFNTQKYFINKHFLKYVTLKFLGITTKVETSEEFKEYLPKLNENNYIFFSKGIVEVTFTNKERYERIVDYHLDEDYLPIGFITESGKVCLYRIDDKFVKEGIADRFVKFKDVYIGDSYIKSVPMNIIGNGLFQCNCCGKVEDRAIDGFCKACYQLLSRLARFSVEPLIEIVYYSKKDFKLSIEKYDIEGKDGKIVLTRNYEGRSGIQQRLPFEEAYKWRLERLLSNY